MTSDTAHEESRTPEAATEREDQPNSQLKEAAVLTPEELAEEQDELAAEQESDAETEAALAIYPWFRSLLEHSENVREQADEKQKAKRKAATAVLDSLTKEQREAVEQWVGTRDRMQQAHGSVNTLKRLSTPVHNLDASLARARKEVSLARHQRNAIKSSALAQGVKLSRKLMGKKKKKKEK